MKGDKIMTETRIRAGVGGVTAFWVFCALNPVASAAGTMLALASGLVTGVAADRITRNFHLSLVHLYNKGYRIDLIAGSCTEADIDKTLRLLQGQGVGETENGTRQFILSKIEKGFSQGAALDLMQRAFNNPKATCAQLLEQVDRAQAIYCQVVYEKSSPKEASLDFLVKKVVMSESFLCAEDLSTYEGALKSILPKDAPMVIGRVIIQIGKVEHTIFFQYRPEGECWYYSPQSQGSLFRYPNPASLIYYIRMTILYFFPEHATVQFAVCRKNGV